MDRSARNLIDSGIYTPDGTLYNEGYRDGAKAERERFKTTIEDAEKWRAYMKRKNEVIAAGMGRKALRGTE